MDRPKLYWKTVPKSSMVIFLLGVFFLFTIIGFAVDVMQLGSQPVPRLVVSVLLNGLFAVGYAISGVVLRKGWWKGMVPLFLLQMLVSGLLPNVMPTLPQPVELGATALTHTQQRLIFSATAIIVAMVLGYVCFLYVSITEGRRYFRAFAEIELATEIHRTLVPTIDTTIGAFEFYGRSLPSGEVGGDLIDVFQDERGWIAYVADVSGHGVAPGVVMGMVKSAARMRLSSADKSTGLLERLNSVLYSVTRPEIFVTFAYLASDGERLQCAYSLAGHPAILHSRAASREFSEVACSNLPLAMFDKQTFASGSVDSGPGDLFLVLTDGILEVEDQKGEEFGLEGVKKIVLEHAGESNKAIFDSLVEAARHHGRAMDDQSLLLVRRTVKAV